ncbi:DUF2017 family protein [Microbacterium murale]|uniref:DUF2017 domain-containing protein n=1 Tax=Microbacterium murale TaxID=1081040 RepID=A0ABQ1RRK8_9MICO|nr:DUF2017 family protein [Microbacterium murale]GGD77222.1 hypothetical protein GCM10007269_20220 [Microbacterium murale]
MTDAVIRLPLAVVEGIHLAGLVEEFTDVLAGFDDEPDPGLVRLTPDPYPEDAEASAEFAAATHDDLLDRRTADAAVVRNGLTPFLTTAAEDLADDDALARQDVVIAASDLDSWLRTLTALRLVIATRLDITAEDDEHDLEDPRFGVYDWLGFRLDGLIALADAQDL